MAVDFRELSRSAHGKDVLFLKEPEYTDAYNMFDEHLKEKQVDKAFSDTVSTIDVFMKDKYASEEHFIFRGTAIVKVLT